ncbi:hypothetical protein LZ31DRAFT_19658 [Colletotrichum somersetense]|nr:hypothetical protein LZ31DRAFT_19658 [Colletotrichum somersetense]
MNGSSSSPVMNKIHRPCAMAETRTRKKKKNHNRLAGRRYACECNLAPQSLEAPNLHGEPQAGSDGALSLDEERRETNWRRNTALSGSRTLPHTGLVAFFSPAFQVHKSLLFFIPRFPFCSSTAPSLGPFLCLAWSMLPQSTPRPPRLQLVAGRFPFRFGWPLG